MKHLFSISFLILIISGFLFGCETSHHKIGTNLKNMDTAQDSKYNIMDNIVSPQSIPDEYYKQSSEKGQLIDFYYDTYESFSYKDKTTKLRKHAIIYLPYDYNNEMSYNILYLMHGGWSNETTYLGTPYSPSDFKNVIDNAIEKQEIRPMIIVCPTYNNESPEDSADYSLAIKLTDNYHNELEQDLIPAVEKTFHTFAKTTDKIGLIESRYHRAFAGFSMGSVTTWRIFEHSLEYFAYFFPSSGSISNDERFMASIPKSQGYSREDFFILAQTGSDDFAARAFKTQIMAMLTDESHMYQFSNNESEGNLYFMEQPSGVHNAFYAEQYTYNAMKWLWNSEKTFFTSDTTLEQVFSNSCFQDFGRLLFPVNLDLSKKSTLEDISNSKTFIWYSHIKKEKTVEILNYLKDEADRGDKIFYSIYSNDEIMEDRTKADTGLFFFRGEPGNRFAITNAGGGFYYVGAMHDSFPHALELSKRGYNAFALIYRPNYAYEDLARAIVFIYDHANELNIDRNNYSIWGGSAGARMAAVLGNREYLRNLTFRNDIPQASAIIMQYTGYSEVSIYDASTFSCVGKNDVIASWKSMSNRIEQLKGLGIDAEFEAYEGLSHGFGLGTDTIAEGWINNAIDFWNNQSPSSKIKNSYK